MSPNKNFSTLFSRPFKIILKELNVKVFTKSF